MLTFSVTPTEFNNGPPRHFCRSAVPVRCRHRGAYTTAHQDAYDSADAAAYQDAYDAADAAAYEGADKSADVSADQDTDNDASHQDPRDLAPHDEPHRSANGKTCDAAAHRDPDGRAHAAGEM